MKRGNVYEGLKGVLTEKFKLDRKTIVPEAKLHDDLGLDSVEIMDAICLFEEKFDVRIIEGSKEGLALPATVGGLSGLIAEKLSDRQRK